MAATNSVATFGHARQNSVGAFGYAQIQAEIPPPVRPIPARRPAGGAGTTLRRRVAITVPLAIVVHHPGRKPVRFAAAVYQRRAVRAPTPVIIAKSPPPAPVRVPVSGTIVRSASIRPDTPVIVAERAKIRVVPSGTVRAPRQTRRARVAAVSSPRKTRKIADDRPAGVPTDVETAVLDAL